MNASIDSGIREVSPQVSLFTDTLLRRGFPVRIEDRGLAFCKGVIAEDIEYFHQLTKTLVSNNAESNLCVWSGDDLVAKIDISDKQSLTEVRSQILDRHSRRRETQPEGRCDNCKDWEGFLKNRFGSSVAVEELEQGVALLVKVLPWIGVHTSMSCHGHGEIKNPKIWFYGYYHSRWCELIFERLFGDLDIAGMWRFSHGPKEGDWTSADWQVDVPTEDDWDGWEDSRFRMVDEQIQVMARRLFNPELCLKIRNLRHEASSMEELPRLLDECLV